MGKLSFNAFGYAALLLATPCMANQYASLLQEAFHAQSGSASGIVTGRIPESMRRFLGKPDASILATVTTLPTQLKPGCKRMRIALSPIGVVFQATDGRKGPISFNVDVNHCEP